MNTKKTTVKTNVNRELVETVRGRIISLLSKRNGQWTGSMTDLSAAMTTGLGRSVPTNWPKSPSFLRQVVNVAVPALRKAGVSVQFGRTTDHMRSRFVSFSRNS